MFTHLLHGTSVANLISILESGYLYTQLEAVILGKELENGADGSHGKLSPKDTVTKGVFPGVYMTACAAR